MKKMIALLSMSLMISTSAFAAEVLCSLNVGDTRYKLAIDFDTEAESEEEADRPYISITASSISATQRGYQSQYQVANQRFNVIDQGEDAIFEPIKESYTISGQDFDLTQVIFVDGGSEDITIKVSGPALKAQLTFTNCLTADY